MNWKVDPGHPVADAMFRMLMGDKVEPRREFIEKHLFDHDLPLVDGLIDGVRQ